MIKNPIVFLGYSLTDRNVKKLLSDFSSQLPREDGRKSAERIILIEYKENEQEVVPNRLPINSYKLHIHLLKQITINRSMMRSVLLMKGSHLMMF